MKNPVGEPWGLDNLPTEAVQAFEPSRDFLDLSFAALKAAVDYLQDHSPTPFEDRPPIEGQYEANVEPRDGRAFALGTLRHRFRGLDGLNEDTASAALAEATPPLPPDPTIVPWALETLLTNRVEENVRRILGWLIRTAQEGPEAARPIIKQRLIEFTDARRLDLRFGLAEMLINATVDALSRNVDESSAYLATIAADPLAPQWMLWRAQCIWYYDDDENFHYGPRPEAST